MCIRCVFRKEGRRTQNILFFPKTSSHYYRMCVTKNHPPPLHKKSRDFCSCIGVVYIRADDLGLY